MKIILAALLSLCATTAIAAPSYKPAGAVPLGSPERWDYAVVDPATGRVYVAHGDKETVIDGRAGKVVGDIEGIAGGTHGAAISSATGQGFADDGRGGLAVVFDLKTLKVTKQIKAEPDADGIAFYRPNGHVFIIDGDPGKVTVIDPKSDTVVATIAVGEKLEYGFGGDGAMFVAGEEKGDLVKIDPRSNKVLAHWPAADCMSPHGLTVDERGHRAFLGCANAKMVVLDTRTGKVVADLPIGRGNDAMAFDPVRKRVFSSNGRDGTITVYQEVTPDKFVALEDVKTLPSGRTMDVDPVTGRLFVVAADLDPASPAGQRPRMLAGSARLLMYDPVRP